MSWSWEPMRCAASVCSRSICSPSSRSRRRRRSATSCSARRPLGRVTLEVGRDRRGDLVDRAVELLADLRDARPVLVERALQTLGLVGDLGLDRGHELLLPGADTLELGRQALLQARDLRAPVGEALLDGPLGLGERGAELRGRVPLALGDVAAAFLDDAPLLLGEGRGGLRPGERERLLELVRAALGLGGDDRVEPRLAALDLVVEALRGLAACDGARRRPRPLPRTRRGRRGSRR